MTPTASAANGPCYDGRCKTTVSAPKTITVDSRKFGFGKLKITSVSSRSAKMSAAGGEPQRQHQPGRHRQVQQPEDLGEVGLRRQGQPPTVPHTVLSLSSNPGAFVSRRGSRPRTAGAAAPRALRCRATEHEEPASAHVGLEGRGAQVGRHADDRLGRWVREAGQEETPLFLGAAADREDADARWRGGGEGGGHGGQPAADSEEMELGEPVAGGVRDLGALVQARPHAHQPVLAGGRTRDPALPAQVGDVDALAAGRRVGGGRRPRGRLVARHCARVEARVLNVTDTDAIARLAEDRRARFGGVDIVISNASRVSTARRLDASAPRPGAPVRPTVSITNCRDQAASPGQSFSGVMATAQAPAVANPDDRAHTPAARCRDRPAEQGGASTDEDQGNPTASAFTRPDRTPGRRARSRVLTAIGITCPGASHSPLGGGRCGRTGRRGRRRTRRRR
ncbi:hypothetical protein SAMN04490356_0142 [Streptomyces melanosporofaciens]|uniref:Short chain dehydrogenase n=1 Tax=Streptomyces melanosporofaciens TaxID=67327 RepID=A0A1H4I7I7_STRMJ|nr:hypothetical protein SAMN04490356_0142 [Streptomyces melanosporofaciens]